MLSLSRRITQRHEVIVIEHAGERLEFWPYKLEHGQVHLAFDGPRSFAVTRGELLSPSPDEECRLALRANGFALCGIEAVMKLHCTRDQIMAAIASASSAPLCKRAAIIFSVLGRSEVTVAK